MVGHKSVAKVRTFSETSKKKCIYLSLLNFHKLRLLSLVRG